MADEIRVTPEGAATTPPRETTVRPAPSDPARRAPIEVETRVPDYEDPERARADIEATRARMSETIDEIEGVLVRKKEEIQSKLDVTAPLRKNPWATMGIALGSGLVLGLLTGGDDDEDDDDHDGPYVVAATPSYRAAASYRTGASYGTDESYRTEALEQRTRRLLAIAREQEEEIRRLRGKKKKRKGGESTSARLARSFEDRDHDLEHETRVAGGRTSSSLDGLWTMVEDGITALLRDAVRQMIRRR